MEYLFDHLSESERLLLGWESAGWSPGSTIQNIAALFQAAHNLKSGLAMEGLPATAQLWHDWENQLDRVRRGQSSWSPDLGELALTLIDATRQALESGREAVFEASPEALSPGSSGPESRFAPGPGRYRLDKTISDRLSVADFLSLPFWDDLETLGQVESVFPEPGSWLPSRGASVVISVTFRSAKTPAEIADALYDPVVTLRPPASPSARWQPGQPLKMLVVEDHNYSARLMQMLLKGHGETTHADDGQAAWQLWHEAWAQNDPFHLVFLDLYLPGRDGRQLLRDFRQFEEEQGIKGLDRCRVVINSALNDLPTVKDAFTRQADGFLIKPYSADKVESVVTKLKAGRL